MKRYQFKEYLKVVSVILVTCSLSFLVGCGSSESDTEEETLPKIGVEAAEHVDDDSEDEELEEVEYSEDFELDNLRIVAHDLSDGVGQRIFVAVDVTNISDMLATDAQVAITAYDADDNSLFTFDLTNAPVMYPGETYTLADWAVDETGEVDYIDVEVWCDDPVEIDDGSGVAAVCTVTSVDYEDETDELCIHWDEEYVGLPEDIEAPRTFNTFIFTDENGEFVAAAYCSGDAFGENGEVGNAYYRVPAVDYENVEVYCYNLSD